MHVHTCVLLALITTCASLYGQTPTAADPSTADTKKDALAVDPRIHTGARAGDDYEGKRLSFPVAIKAKLQYDRNKTVCLPARTKLRGMSQLTKDGLLVRLREEGVLFKEKKNKENPDGPPELLPDYMCQGQTAKRSDSRDAFHESLVINEDDVNSIPANISGLT